MVDCFNAMFLLFIRGFKFFFMMSFSNAVKSRLALLSISSHLMEFVVSVEGADGTLVGGGD